MAERTPWQRQELQALAAARSREAARQIRDGEIVVSLACGHCGSTSIVDADRPHSSTGWVRANAPAEVIECLNCGQLTTMATAHTIRRQKITEIIRRGVDLPRPSRGSPL